MGFWRWVAAEALCVLAAALAVLAVAAFAASLFCLFSSAPGWMLFWFFVILFAGAWADECHSYAQGLRNDRKTA